MIAAHDLMHIHFKHSVLKFAQDQAFEKIDDYDEFMYITIPKKLQDTGRKVFDIVHYDNCPIHMLRYIEDSKEWKGFFKRKKKPDKRKRTVLIDEDETEECKRIIVNKAWLIENFGEEYTNNLKEASLQKRRDSFLIINKGSFMKKTDLTQSHIRFTKLKIKYKQHRGERLCMVLAFVNVLFYLN